MAWKIKSELIIVKPYWASLHSKTCTLSRWIYQVLKYAGINTKMFTSHSVRAVSTWKIKTLGISLSQILKKGQ